MTDLSSMPAGRNPQQIHQFAVSLMKRLSRDSLELSYIDLHKDNSPIANISVKGEAPSDSEITQRIIRDVREETGWEITLKFLGSSNSGHDTITGIVVESEAVSCHGDLDIIDVETTPVNLEESSLAKRSDAGSFGLVPLNYTKSTLALVSTGDSQELASHMLDDGDLIAALASVSPYKVSGLEEGKRAVQEDIIALQTVTPVDQASKAGGRLCWALRDLVRLTKNNEFTGRFQEYIGTVASMLLTAISSVSDEKEQESLRKPYLELLKSIDQGVSESIATLLKGSREGIKGYGSKDAFQALFSRLVTVGNSVAQSISNAKNSEQVDRDSILHDCGKDLLLGSLILRQIVHVFRDPGHDSLVPVISRRFAEELRGALVDKDAKAQGFLLILSGSREITLDFFQAVLKRHIGERDEGIGQVASTGRYSRPIDNTMPEDVVQCLLGVGCMVSPSNDGFYGQLEGRYERMTPAVKIQLLQAMKFSIGEDTERTVTLISRVIDLLRDDRPATKHLVQNDARDLLRNFPAELIEYLVVSSPGVYQALNKEARKLILEEVLVFSCGSGARSTIDKVAILPLLEQEIELSGTKALSGYIMKAYLDNNLVASLEEGHVALLTRALLLGIPSFESAGEKGEARRILSKFGFSAIYDAFQLAAEKRHTEPELSQHLMLISAELTSKYKSDDPRSLSKIRSFTLETIIPTFLARASGKIDAGQHLKEVATEAAETRRELAMKRSELRRLTPTYDLIVNHPGYQRITGENNFENRRGEMVAVRGTLEVLQSRVIAAENVGDDSVKAEVESTIAEIMSRCLPKVSSYPGWSGKLPEVPLAKLVQMVELYRKMESEIESLDARLRDLEGRNELETPQETMGGTKIWRGEVSEVKAESLDAFKASAKSALIHGRILRLFLASPSIDRDTAQVAYDMLPAHESASATARFALSLRYKIVDSVTMQQAEEVDGEDSYRAVILDEFNIDLGPGEEAEELTQIANDYNPEDDFTGHFSNAVAMIGFEEEVQELTASVRELCEMGVYIPGDVDGHPLLATILARLNIERNSNFSSNPIKAASHSWTRASNEDGISILLHCIRAQTKESRTELDREYRGIALAWLRSWDPPRDHSMLSSAFMLNSLEAYLTDQNNAAKRRAEIGIRYAKSALDYVDLLPHSQRSAYLNAFEKIRNNFPTEILKAKVKVEIEDKDGKSEVQVRPSELFETLISRLKLLCDTGKAQTYQSSIPNSLRLPFGRTSEGSFGLLPAPNPNRPQLGA